MKILYLFMLLTIFNKYMKKIGEGDLGRRAIEF